jgi:hypothetical protein
VAAAEAAFSLEIVHLDDEESTPALSREVSSKYKRYAKIGAATLVGGAIIGASGSLAAPAVIAAAAMMGSTVAGICLHAIVWIVLLYMWPYALNM